MSNEISLDELHQARDLMLATGSLTQRWFKNTDLAIEDKADGTPVTQADLEAESFVREQLAELAPHDAVIGEEQIDTQGSSGRRWYVDPIDGTHGFTKGVPLYANLLALYDETGPLIGVINLPATDEIIYAGRGLGCYCNSELVRVSTVSSLDQALITSSGFGYWDRTLLLAVHSSGSQMRTWGDGYGYAMVATGRAEAMFDPEVSPWDLAPMPIILAEAGGRFSSFDGEAGIEGGTGLASNGLLHEELLRLVSSR